MELTLTPGELERQAALALEGKTFEVMACLNPGGLGLDSTAAEWIAAEVSGNGYVRESFVAGAGAWNALTLQYELPEAEVVFSATDLGYAFDTLVVLVQGATYPHAIASITPVSLLAGTGRSYPLQLAQRSYT